MSDANVNGRSHITPETGAYEYFVSLINSRAELDSALMWMIREKRLTEWETIHLERPNSTYRQRFIVVRDIISRHPELAEQYARRDLACTWLLNLRQHMQYERNLRDALGDRQVIQDIIDMAGIDLGRVNDISPILSSGSINHPLQLNCAKGRYFLRYTSALGGESFLRSHPKETVFRHLLGEKIFRRFLGDDVTTVTLYPSLEQAKQFHLAPEPEFVKCRIMGRILLQPFYGDTHFRIQEYSEHSLSFQWLLRVFAHVNAAIHAGTLYAQRLLQDGPTTRYSREEVEFVRKYREYFRYSSAEDYGTWLREVNWVSHMIRSMNPRLAKEFPSTDLSIIECYDRAKVALLNDGVDVEQQWWQCVDECIVRWTQGAVLTGPDIKPSNVFYSPEGKARLFDFDYFAFFDPAYHLGQGLYTMLRFLTTKENQFSPKEAEETASSFVSFYLTKLRDLAHDFGTDATQILESESFIGDVFGIASLTFFLVMAHDIKERNLTSQQWEAILLITKRLLKARGGCPTGS